MKHVLPRTLLSVVGLPLVGLGCGRDVVPAQSTAIDVQPAADGGASTEGDSGDADDNGFPGRDKEPPRQVDPCLSYGDADGDCWLAWDDCDDGNAAINPDAAEVCGNMIDDNCDGNAAPCGFGPGEVDLETVASGVLVNDFDYYVDGCQGMTDLSGDGLPDAVLGNWWGRDAKGGTEGSLHVVFGPVSGTRNLNTADVILRGDALGGEGSFGGECPLADVDGDGLDDLVVVDGFRGYQHNSDWSYLTFASQAYVWFSPVTDLLGEQSAQSADLIVSTESVEQGISHVLVGDLTGDGVADLHVGTWGYPGFPTTSGIVVTQTKVLAGPFDSATIDTSMAVSTIRGIDGYDEPWGSSLVDLNGDGMVDIVGQSDCSIGNVVVFPGPVTPGDVDPSTAAVWTNGTAHGNCGDGVGVLDTVDAQGTFDLDGDGLNDLAAFNGVKQSAKGVQTGVGYLLLGPATGGGPIDEGADLVVIGDGSEYFGMQQAFADFDGDGATDWLVGSDPNAAFPDKRQLGILAGPIEPGVHTLDEAVSTWMPGDLYPYVGSLPLVIDARNRTSAVLGATAATRDASAFLVLNFGA